MQRPTTASDLPTRRIRRLFLLQYETDDSEHVPCPQFRLSHTFLGTVNSLPVRRSTPAQNRRPTDGGSRQRR